MNIPKEWGTDFWGDLLTYYKKLVLDKVLKSKEYTVGKYNLLKNDWVSLHDQIPHRYYHLRSTS